MSKNTEKHNMGILQVEEWPLTEQQIEKLEIAIKEQKEEWCPDKNIDMDIMELMAVKLMVYYNNIVTSINPDFSATFKHATGNEFIITSIETKLMSDKGNLTHANIINGFGFLPEIPENSIEPSVEMCKDIISQMDTYEVLRNQLMDLLDLILSTFSDYKKYYYSLQYRGQIEEKLYFINEETEHAILISYVPITIVERLSARKSCDLYNSAGIPDKMH